MVMAIVTGLPQGLFAYLIPILFQSRSKHIPVTPTVHKTLCNPTKENHLAICTTKNKLKKVQTLEWIMHTN